MSAVTTTTKYTGKKRYGSSYGKYYTYKRLRTIMSNYFRAKLSIMVQVQIGDALEYVIRVTSRQNAAANTFSAPLYDLYANCLKYTAYRQLYGYRKLRGILIEAIPGPVPQVTMIDGHFTVPYDGGIRLALSENLARPTWIESADLNMGFILSPTESIRKYFPVFLKDFSRVRNDDNSSPTGIPYYLHITQGANLANRQREMAQKWQVRLTFYVTFRQPMA